MYKLLLITLLTNLLLANNPKPYAVLGDVIYDNVDKIESLEKIDAYGLYKEDIIKYVAEVNKTKSEGFKLEAKKSALSNKEYLNKLRSLSKTNDFYLRSVKSNYHSSMKNDNYDLFSDVINSGLMNTDECKQEIIDYYYKHKEDINASGVIENFLNKDAALKALKEAQRKKYKTKKMREEEKIKRIRAEDAKAKAALEKKLETDLENKKLKIRQEQKRELAK